MRRCVDLPLIPSGIFLFLLNLNGEAAFTQPIDSNSNFGNPLVVLVEHNPWLMVLNSDEPTIVIYANGKIIYQKIEDDRKVFYCVTLDSVAFDSLMRDLNFDDDSILNFPNSIDPYENDRTSMGDLPTNELYIYSADSVKLISIYGSLFTNTFYKWTPPYLANIVKKLKEFSSPVAEIWQPQKIEVVVWGYEYSPEIPAEWPDDWPDIKGKDAYVHETSNTGDMYSIYLDSEHLDELKDLLANDRLHQAILMNGRKWALRYRFPFPHEPKWWW